jgi:uncharacterized protein YaaQ
MKQDDVRGGLPVKLIIAIIQDEDASRLINELMTEGYRVTKLATTGGFLRAGNTTLLIGVEDEKLDEALDLIRKNCAKRMERVPAMPATEMAPMVYHTTPAEVMVGGAIVFVTDVCHYEKM